jgi:hypothetical protein
MKLKFAPITLFAIFSQMFACFDSNAAERQTYYATDTATGNQIKLVSSQGRTLVTNIATGEMIEEKGEFAEKVDSEVYTELMRDKRRHYMSLHPIEVQQRNSWATLNSWNYSFTSASPWSTPQFWLGNTTKLTAVINAYNGTNPVGGPYTRNNDATLYRYRNWWPDYSYGVRSFTTYIYNSQTTLSWNNLDTPGAYYYITLKDPFSTGLTLFGTITVSQ